MELDVYTQLRTDLIKGYQFITGRPFQVMAPMQIFMTIDQIENAEHVVKNNFLVDGNPLTNHLPYRLTPEQIMEIYTRINKQTKIGFVDPFNVIDIYDTISVYLRNWMRVANQLPGYPLPLIDELYKLEDFSVWLFTSYKQLVLQREGIERIRNTRTANQETDPFLMLELLGFHKSPNSGKLEFESVLDQQLPQEYKRYHEDVQKAQSSKWILDPDDLLRM